MDLVIVESPAKAKTIEKYLGDGYSVVSSVGHIRDLPKSEKEAVDIKNNFTPTYEISKGKDRVVKDLKRAAKKAQRVYLATDPDREGEAIAWHIREVLKHPHAKRVSFNEITEKAVLQAMQHPRNINDHLRQSQEARRVLDRLFGYALSKLIWTKVRYGLSAGRVQSPALRILMEREREIEAFIPTPYWVLSATMETGGKEFLAQCTEEIVDEKFAKWIVETAPNAQWSIADIKTQEVTRSPRPPFITSTLQQAANSRLNFSPSQTMKFAQGLYEKGHTSYMRTDSLTISAEAHPLIKQVVEKEYGKETYDRKDYITRKKSAQEAHEAIRPTNPSKAVCGANANEEALYTLIWQRTLASQMKPAKLLRRQIPFSSPAKKDNYAMPLFVIRGVSTLFPGWLLADPESKGEDVELPDIKPNAKARCIEVQKEDKETAPLNRFSEAGLVKELEKREIGRPSTYASTIKTLQDREYVTKVGRTLYPTPTGAVISGFLEEHFNTYIGDTFTADMERQLDDIADGSKTYANTLTGFYHPFIKAVESKKDASKITTLGDADPEIKCPQCGKKMIKKLGRNGVFLSCSDFPDCSGARMEDGSEIKREKTGKPCPKCSNGSLIIRTGRFGDFIGCSNYPKCKYIEQSEEQKKKVSTNVSCPQCKKGEIVERVGRFGVFYGCEHYPKCSFTMNAKPTGEKCHMCGSLMMDGTKTIPDRCSDKSCPNNRPDQIRKEKEKKS